MSEITIVGGGSLDLTMPLSFGDNIDFLNDSIAAGTLTIESTALENTTFTSGMSFVSTGIGGFVEGFQPGDTIILRDLATDYIAFDQSPNAAAQNISVANELNLLVHYESVFNVADIFTIAPSGIVTTNFTLLDPDIASYAVEIDQALFGDTPQTADLFITLAADAAAGVDDAIITSDGEFVICYLQGTNILTPTGERPVEALRSGDLLITHSGGFRPIKWIGVQSFGARFVANNRERLPVKIAAGALADGLPLRDLHVSPGHSLLLGGKLILARYLINGTTITQPARAKDTHYYLIEFETHDCVLAEGIWAESYADAVGLRNQFHNAAEFYRNFPGHAAPDAPKLYAPRPEAGPALEAALRPILDRALITPGPLRGYVETIQPTPDGCIVEGWAYDAANPLHPVLVNILAGSEILGQALACHHRGDLQAAGLGSGRCLFTHHLPNPPPPKLHVARTTDGHELAFTPNCSRAA